MSTPPKAPGPPAATNAKMAEAAQQVAKQAQKVTRSAQHLEASAGAVVESADLQLISAERRTVLAANRTLLAVERTYAAWVRTGMAALASGAAVRPLLEDRWAHWIVLLTASVLLAFAVFCFAAGVWRQLQPDPPPPEPALQRIPVWMLVSANGALTIAALAALAEIWLAGG
jgi:putative membrane protein